MRQYLFAGLAGFAIVALATAVPTAARSATDANKACFSITDWNGWKATPDAKTVYIRVMGRGLYRLDLASACSQIHEPDSHLVTSDRNTGTVCNPVDLDLRVSVGHGISTPCIVSQITRLTASESAALPRGLRP